MTTDTTTTPTRGRPSARRLALTLAGLATGGLALWPGVLAGAASAAPAVTMTPSSGGGYHAGQKVTISVGPNQFFTRYSRIEILMCADKKGLSSNLPIDDTTCDGNTVEGNSVLVAKNGSFRETGYPLYALPDKIFSEGPTDQPICNRTHSCVLYVGQNQNSFKSPKVFTAPFVVMSAQARRSR
jgi:hypothetical protein